jgi:hypothetical protein
MKLEKAFDYPPSLFFGALPLAAQIPIRWSN